MPRDFPGIGCVALALGCLAIWKLGDSTDCCCLLVILVLSLLIFRNLTD